MTVAIITTPLSMPDLLGTAPSDLIPSDAERHDSTLDEARARSARLTAGIVGYAQMRQDIADAFAGRDWLVLGYASWDAYVEGEFGELLAKLDRGERRQAVGDLRGQGMSVRQIASATGASYGTVRNDLAEVSKTAQLPEKVIGSDGKEHPATRPTPKPTPTPEPVETPSTVPAGSGSPSPETEPEHQLSEPVPGLAERVAAVLAGHGNPPFGITIPQIWVKLSDVHSADLPAALAELAEDGRAVVMGHAEGNAPIEQRARWILRPSTPDERIAAVAQIAPEFVQPVETSPKPTLTLVPDADEKRSSEQRDARGLLRRAVEILAPDHDPAGFAATWARQLGSYDEELSVLIRRAHVAIATLDELIEGCGQ